MIDKDDLIQNALDAAYELSQVMYSTGVSLDEIDELLTDKAKITKKGIGNDEQIQRINGGELMEDLVLSTAEKKFGALFSSNSNEWCTPKWLFEALNQEFNFTVDSASTHENALCERHWTKAEDGLLQSWDFERVFCNPPYGRELKQWVKKASGIENGVAVLLIPSRTDTSYWHDYIFGKATDIRFMRGRLKFSNSKNSAPFPSAIVIFDSRGQ